MSEKSKNIETKYTPTTPLEQLKATKRQLTPQELDWILKPFLSEKPAYPHPNSIYLQLTGKNEDDLKETDKLRLYEESEVFKRQFLGFYGHINKERTFSGRDESNHLHQFIFNHWLYYLYFPEGQDTKSSIEAAKYRIYLKPRMDKLMFVLQSLMRDLEKTPEFQQAGYTLKLPNLLSVTPKLHSIDIELLTQNDRLILYLNEECGEIALEALEKMTGKSPEFFEEFSSIAQPAVPSAGNKIYIASEVPQEKGSFNSLQSGFLYEAIQRMLTTYNNNFKTQLTLEELFERCRQDPETYRAVRFNIFKIYKNISVENGFSEHNIAFLKDN